MQQSQHRSQYWKHCLKSSTELLSRAASESIYVYTCVCVYVYIYIERERERESRSGLFGLWTSVSRFQFHKRTLKCGILKHECGPPNSSCWEMLCVPILLEANISSEKAFECRLDFVAAERHPTFRNVTRLKMSYCVM